MNQKHEILISQLCLAILAAAFCVWSASGNEVNLCITAGCTLFQDTTVAGISLWWLGSGMFALLALLALSGAAGLGFVVSGLALLSDVLLLLLMSVTAPCVSCLLVAIFFALLFSGFRRAAARRRTNAKPGRSLLLVLWSLLFIVNVGAVLRTQADVWAITDNGADATVRMFFSPSCPSCKEGISALSGHVDVAFYPLAETEADIYKTARMRQLLDNGASMAEALSQAQDAVPPVGMNAFSPDILLLRLRMLRNKAHVFMAGAQTVPFFEYHGLPTMLIKQNKTAKADQPPALPPSSPPQTPPVTSTDAADLPLEPQVSGQCSGTAPCP